MLDVLILGSGPAGLSAAIYASRANLSYRIIEKEADGAGQIKSTSIVDNYPGFPQISGYALGEALRNHAIALGAEFCIGEVTAIEKLEHQQTGKSFFRVSINNDSIPPLESKTVLYALGAEHLRLGIPGEEELIGAGVCFCSVCDGAFFKGLDVAVIGGGNSALGDALHMSTLANKVYLVHRRSSFRAAASIVEKVKNTPNIELVLDAVPARFEGEDELEAILMADGRRIQVQGAFVAVGMKPRTELAAGLVPLDAKGYIVADETGVTAADGFFAAGDVRTKALRQVITAAADGANAIQSITDYLQVH